MMSLNRYLAGDPLFDRVVGFVAACPALQGWNDSPQNVYDNAYHLYVAVASQVNEANYAVIMMQLASRMSAASFMRALQGVPRPGIPPVSDTDDFDRPILRLGRYDGYDRPWNHFS